MLIDINVPYSDYKVRVGSPIEDLKDYIRQVSEAGRMYLVTDSNVGELYGTEIKNILKDAGIDLVYKEIPAGEEYKNFQTAESIIKDMCEKKIERFTPVIGFGGGVIGDLAGFVASIYMRGLPFINIPTSLIAQVDSSIGGKTGVNLIYGKNLVGTFCQPVYVYTDIDFLNTLKEEEYRSGLGEVIKHAVIKGENFLKFMEENIDPILKINSGPAGIMVAECIKIKGDIVVADEKEKGLRRILNLGHTFGHAIETVSGYGTLKHGEGVSIGMVAALMISEAMGKCSLKFVTRIKNLLQRCSLPVTIPGNIDIKELVEYMYMDKKVRDSKLRFVLPVSPGQVEASVGVEEDLVLKVARKLV
ncbi:MAG: 3-dehydroquinate synthase [Elusimicrobia bacterium]|jgi:3-dehydroquinate synthase|nr:3-dehydroquinate synthase [Elusimicrobiota bacterium]